LSELYQGFLSKQDSKDPAAAELTKLEELERTAATEAKTALERDQAKFSEAFKGREKRLTDRELDITKQKDVNTGLALLNAGLSIMSTPGGLATAIGKGAQVGTAQFAAGLDKIRSAQERLDEARDRMEELRLDRDEMSAREVRAAETDIRNVAVNAQKRAIDGIRTAADSSAKAAGDMFKAAVQVGVAGMEIQGRKDVAGMQERGASERAARTPAEIQMVERIMAEKKLPFSEALNYLTAAKREPVSQEKLRADWLDPTKRMQIAQDYPNVKTFDDYALVMGAGTGGGAGGFKLVGVR